MEHKSLCIRTFADALQTRMNVKVFEKDFETDRGINKNFRKDIHFLSLLFKSLAHGLPENETESLPDLNKPLVSRLLSGEKDSPNEYLALIQRKDVVKNVGEFFARTLTTPNYITKDSLRIAVDAIAELIENDASLGKSTQSRFKKLKLKMTEADYLAEAWTLAVSNNKNCLIPRKENAREKNTNAENLKNEISNDMAFDNLSKMKIHRISEQSLSVTVEFCSLQPSEKNHRISPHFPSVITESRPLQPSDFFRGRDRQLEEVKKILFGSTKLMLLNGMGGIGKTEFCRKLFNECINEKLPEVKKVGWLIFHDSIEQTFFLQFTELAYRTDNPAEYFAQAVKYLDDQRGDLLLFIDNANDLSEKDAALLSQLSCKIVLTSRRRSVDRLQPVEIGKLTIEDCRILYRQHSEEYPFHNDYNYGVTFAEDDSPSDDLDAIIEMADRHTLAIELLAKTQKSAAYTTHEMRETLERTGFSLSDISESVTYVHTPETGDWDKSEQIFIEQFSKVLDISNIKAEKLRVLQLFSLLSAETVSTDNVRNWFELSDLEAVNTLVSQGWVFRGYTGGQTGISFSMHPLITSVVRYKALPDFKTAAPLVIGLSEALSYKDTDLFTSRLPYINHAVSLVEAIDSGYDEYPDLVNCIAVILVQTAEFDKALTLLNKARVIYESANDTDPMIMSTLYHNMAGCYIRQGKVNQAKEWYEKSIQIRENSPEAEDSQLANSYDCLGNVYEMLGDYRKALSLMMHGLEIRNATLEAGHPQIAISHNNIGCIYDSLGDYEQALEHHKTAMAIQEDALEWNHPDLATTYSNIGRIYDRLGDIETALEYYNKALVSGESLLGRDHPEVLTVRDSIANVYLDKGDYHLAETLFAELLEARKRVIGEEHYDTATNYQNIGIALYYQSRLDEALENLNIALEISTRLLGERHPNVAFILKNIADVYSEVEDMADEALEIYKNVLNIQLEAFGENHPYVAISYNNLGEKYADDGDYEQAMKHYEIALRIHENTVGRKHPDTSGTLYNIGRVYEERGKLKTALEYFFEAYEIIKNKYGEEMPEFAKMGDGIAHTYDKLGDYENANIWFENSIRLYIKFFGDTNVHLSVTYHLYAESLERQGRYEDALKIFIMAQEIANDFYEPEHDLVKNIEERIRKLKSKI